MTPAAIDVRGLRRSYRGTPAVADLDLTVEVGELFVLLGPNGAGKTTTVDVCAGFRRADNGQVRVLDADPWRAPPAWRGRVGLVAQQNADFADVTVSEAVADIARYFARSRPVAEVIEAVGLANSRSTRCGQLSTDQRRRLDVALGIVGRPELLFLDEPTVGFDPEARRAFWPLIESVKQDGTTILLTTRYLDEAEELADRLAVMAAGRVVDVGTPQSLGGRDAAAARVRWVGADGALEQRTTTPTAFVAALAESFGGEIPGLVVERPTLEDVYVRMIKRAQTDGAGRR